MSTSDDDWETADLAPVKAKPTGRTATSTPGNSTNLRAGANAFQPSKPAPPSSSYAPPFPSTSSPAQQSRQSDNAEAGPSRTQIRLAPRPSQPSSHPTDGDNIPDLANLSIHDTASPADSTGNSAPGLMKRDEGQGKKSVWAPSGQAVQGTPAIAGRGSSLHFPQLGSGGSGSGARAACAQEGEEEDDWFQAGRPVTNRQIWDNANASSRPTIVNSPQVLPTPGVTILRRSTASGSGSGTGSGRRSGAAGGTQTPPKTIEEREAEYRLARERIFGAGGGTGASAGGGAAGSNASGSTTGQAGDAHSSNEKTGKGKGKSKSASASASASARSSPAPSPPLGPTPTQIGSASASTSNLTAGTSSGTKSQGGTASGTGSGGGRSKSSGSGGGERKRGPAHSGGAMPVLAPPYTGSRGTYSPQGAYVQTTQPTAAVQVQQPGLVRQPRGPGEGAGFGGVPPGSGQNAAGAVYAGGQYAFQGPGATDGHAPYGHPSFEGYGSASTSGYGAGYGSGAGTESGSRPGWSQ